MQRVDDIVTPASSRSLQKQQRRQLAQRIARKRLTTHQPNYPQEAYKDGSSLVFRREIHAALENDLDELQCPYTSTEFLNQHDIVLAATGQGLVDVVRLPRYCPPQSDSRSFRPLGSLLAGKLQLETTPGSTAFLNNLHMKIKSLKGGEVFAVGMPSSFQVFATEHASTWCKNAIQSSPKKLSQQRLKTDSLFTCGWMAQMPKRRFRRSFNTSLWSQARTCWEGADFRFCRHELEEIEGWNTEQPIRHNSSLLCNNHLMWDFRETASSALLAAHVDAAYDCFSLKLMDERSSPSKNVLCMDVEGSNCDVIGATCFTSDHSLATLHQFEGDLTVKIWDMRKMNQQNTETKIATIPAFPLDELLCLKPSHHYSCQRASDPSSSYAVTGFSASSNGSLLITGRNETPFLVKDGVVKRLPIGHGDSLFCTTPTNDFMACMDNQAKAGSQTIDLYDLSRYHSNRALGGSSRKRTFDGELRDDNHVSFPANATDRHGMGSHVSCLALNDTGTALVYGTEDGDLYLWRGA